MHPDIISVTTQNLQLIEELRREANERNRAVRDFCALKKEMAPKRRSIFYRNLLCAIAGIIIGAAAIAQIQKVNAPTYQAEVMECIRD